MGETFPRILLVYNKSSTSYPAFTWLLGRDRKILVDVLAPQKHPVTVSKWIHELTTYESPESILSTLKELIAANSYAAVLSIDESSRKAIFEAKDEDWLQPYLPFPENSPLFDACADKVLFQQWCEDQGVPVPKAAPANTVDEVLKLAEDFDYPFILKGAVGSRGTQVHLVENSEMLSQTLEHSIKSQERWLLQEFIDGPVGSTSFVARHGELYGFCSSYKIMSTRYGMGPSAMRQFTAHPEIERIARTIVSKSGISGVSGFDWMEVEPGVFKVIDPHLGRTACSILVSHYNDLDMCKAFRKSLEGVGPDPIARQSNKHIVWVMPQMLEVLFEGRSREAFRKGNPFRSGVSIFWCGKGEWRLFLKLAVPFIIGQTRVKLGLWRRKCFPRKSK